MAHSTPMQFIVSDMDCQGCVASITEAVKRLDTQASVTADLATKQVVVGSDQESDAITHAIESAGFTVEGVSLFALADPHAGEHGKQHDQQDDEHDNGNAPAQH